MRPPRPPILLDAAYEDPAAVRALVPRNAPYWPVMRYLANATEMRAVGGNAVAQRAGVLPWFRGDWAHDGPKIAGLEPVLENPRFLEAARQLFDGEIVRPQSVYVNLMAPIAEGGEAHLDVPVFRGIERDLYPVWLLNTMGRSGLFRDWQVDVATAVSWFYGGEGGAFDYWAEGHEKTPQRLGAPLDNRAVVGDNDFMFHRVDAIGPANAPSSEDVSLASELFALADGSWEVREGEAVLARYPAEALRVSVSWKALVFRDAEAARRYNERADALELDEVVARLLADLDARGQGVEPPADPLGDTAFVEALSRAHALPDRVYPSEAETRHHATR
ncbi:MAG: hypothetical protein HRU02_16905 [Myxococcales bacterium]|nr:hypothetical protein [Myxococcales bacterium]